MTKLSLRLFSIFTLLIYLANHLQTEVNYLGRLRHPNLVKLVGYCFEGDNRLLVYEFMPKGSLENHLFRSMLHISMNMLEACIIFQIGYFYSYKTYIDVLWTLIFIYTSVFSFLVISFTWSLGTHRLDYWSLIATLNLRVRQGKMLERTIRLSAAIVR